MGIRLTSRGKIILGIVVAVVVICAIAIPLAICLPNGKDNNNNTSTTPDMISTTSHQDISTTNDYSDMALRKLEEVENFAIFGTLKYKNISILKIRCFRQN